MSSTKSKHLQAVIFRYLYCPTVGTEHLSSYFFNLTESILNFTGRRKLRKEKYMQKSQKRTVCLVTSARYFGHKVTIIFFRYF